MFNYIINIHNSESHLEKVISAVLKVKSPQSRVYAVLDGCTDGSQAIAERYGIETIFTPDVRETKAITTVLKQIPQDGYNVVLQDDVLLKDTDFEKHILEAYRKFPLIGVLGMRHGSNLKPDVLANGEYSSETELICNEAQPDMGIEKLPVGLITERQVVYKSPICLSSEVVKVLGGYDERFEPIAHDDTEYCVRAYIAGFSNYVLGIDLDQPVEWGGTRRFPKTHSDNLRMHRDHFSLLRRLYPETLQEMANNHPSLDKIKLW